MSLNIGQWEKAYFTGLSDPFDEIDTSLKCDACEGSGELQIGDVWNPKGRKCYLCHGSGNTVRQMVNVNIDHFTAGPISEKVVNRIFSGGFGSGGFLLSPSRLFIILRTISKLPSTGDDAATAENVRYWYDGLERPIKIPLMVYLEMHKRGLRFTFKHPNLNARYDNFGRPQTITNPASPHFKKSGIIRARNFEGEWKMEFEDGSFDWVKNSDFKN